MNWQMNILFILSLIFPIGLLTIFIVKSFDKNPKINNKTPATPGNITNSKVVNKGVHIHHISAGQGDVRVISKQDGATIRIGRGAKMSATINGKFIELEGPTDKDWEEFKIK